MTTPPIQPKERLDSVQLLRAVAAVAVVLFHIPLFGNGAWGVDLFFVISGFIMCYVTEDSGRRFLTKRIIRIVPLYWAGTIGVFCVALALPRLVSNTSTSAVDLVKSLFFIPFQKGAEVEPVLFLGWTLNYEFFFYVLFALSMAVNHRFRAIIASGLILVIVATRYRFPFESVPYKFLGDQILLEFVFGMLCYAIFKRTASCRAQPRSVASRILWTVAGGAWVACMPVVSALGPLQDRVIELGIPATLAFCCTVHGLGGVRLPRPLVLIGDASYSLYLFHPYVIQSFAKVFHAFSGAGVRAYFMAGVAVALCCGLAVASYQYLEKPVTEYLRKRFV